MLVGYADTFSDISYIVLTSALVPSWKGPDTLSERIEVEEETLQYQAPNPRTGKIANMLTLSKNIIGHIHSHIHCNNLFNNA